MEHDATPKVALKNDPLYTSDFVSLLSTPVLRSFTFESSWQLAWDSFRGAVPSMAKTFGNIESLLLSIGPLVVIHNGNMYPELPSAFPGLRTLGIVAHNSSNVLPYLRMWVKTMETKGNQSELDSTHSVWPKLNMLSVTVSRCSSGDEKELEDALQLLTAQRARLGLPFDVWKGRVQETHADRSISQKAKKLTRRVTRTYLKLQGI